MSFVLILTGMHRSGTSLVASLFEHAGVHLGAHFVSPQVDNPFGFFEDIEFVNFHEDALRARGQNILVTRDFIFTPDTMEEKRARELIAARATRDLWGWKDPRASLFLNFWHTLMPHAHFLFIYRHPFDVILSLARRGEIVGFDFFNVLDAWHTYNTSILEFARQHPDNTLVASSYTIIEHIETFNTALADKLSLALDLNNTTRDAIFHTEHLRRTPRTRATDALLHQIHPDAFALYDALQTFTTLPENDAPENATPEISALHQFAAQLPAPLSEAHRRALLTALVALTDPAMYEPFSRAHVTQTNELENQRRAWEQTANERENIIAEQNAWATPRMEYLQQLESNALVRALIRLGILPRPS